MNLSLALVIMAALAVCTAGQYTSRRLSARFLFVLLIFIFGITAYQLGWQCGANDVLCAMSGNQQQVQPQSGSKPINL